MTNDFASAVDPVVLNVLDVLRRARHGQPIDHDLEHQQLRDLISRGDGLLGQDREWELAKYALVCWADDVLIETPWEGSRWWRDNPLEVKFFSTRQAYSRFYTSAREAESFPPKNALEVFYICVVLGFRGLYLDDNAGAEAEDLQLPSDLQTWAKQTVRSIRLGQGNRDVPGHPEPRQGAPPLEGSYLLLGSLMATATLTLVLLALAIIKLLP